ncbi:hypothetical protein K474DRAFT_1713659 [Panus rudis PR-1116 ss-1]|nr:hypothetical protein K474DRAFT_1713659 [Panus rudis PR-1116 ss-1]
MSSLAKKIQRSKTRMSLALGISSRAQVVLGFSSPEDIHRHAQSASNDAVLRTMEDLLVRDNRTEPDKVFKARRVLKYLWEEREIIPENLQVGEVICNDRDAYTQGSFAEILRATVNGQPVALKYIKWYPDGSERSESALRKFSHGLLSSIRIYSPSMALTTRQGQKPGK